MTNVPPYERRPMTNDKGLDVKLGCAPKIFGQTIRQRQVTSELCARNGSKNHLAALNSPAQEPDL